jgi:hypothetical protein
MCVCVDVRIYESKIGGLSRVFVDGGWFFPKDSACTGTKRAYEL